MKLHAAFVSVPAFLSLFLIGLHAGEWPTPEHIKKLLLPASAFGPDWELTQSNIAGMSGEMVTWTYSNRKRADQPVVEIEIRTFGSSKRAREIWEEMWGYKDSLKQVKKVPPTELPPGAEGYDRLPLPDTETETATPPAPRLKRFILIGHHWLNVGEAGKIDDRAPFLRKYLEVLKTSVASKGA